MKHIPSLAGHDGFWSNFVFHDRNTTDNLTLANKFYRGRVYLLVQGLNVLLPNVPTPPPLVGFTGAVVIPLAEPP